MSARAGREASEKTHVEGEPGVRAADELACVLPLAEVREEVAARGLGRLDALHDRVGVDVVGAGGEDVLDVLRGLLDVALDVHGEAGRLGDGETEVERDDTGDAAEADEEAPHVVDGVHAVDAVAQQRVLLCGDNDVCDDATSCYGRLDWLCVSYLRGMHTELSPALVREDCRHEASTARSRRELGRDDGGKRVIASDTDPHLTTKLDNVRSYWDIGMTYDKPPDDDYAEDVDRLGLTSDSLAECSDDDDHEFDTICATGSRPC